MLPLASDGYETRREGVKSERCSAFFSVQHGHRQIGIDNSIDADAGEGKNVGLLLRSDYNGL